MEIRLSAVAIAAGLFVVLLPFWAGLWAGSFFLAVVFWLLAMVIAGIPLVIVALLVGLTAFGFAWAVSYPWTGADPEAGMEFDRPIPSEERERQERVACATGVVMFLVSMTITGVVMAIPVAVATSGIVGVTCHIVKRLGQEGKTITGELRRQWARVTAALRGSDRRV